MANEAISMTFASLFAAQVEGLILAAPPLKADFYMAAPDNQRETAHFSNRGKEPSKPLQLTGPASSAVAQESSLARMKRDRHFPRQVELVIYNTERMPRDYMEDMLKRIFHEKASSALILSYKRHIHEGPYTREAARTKADSVRLDAENNNVPIPQIRYLPVKRTL